MPSWTNITTAAAPILVLAKDRASLQHNKHAALQQSVAPGGNEGMSRVLAKGETCVFFGVDSDFSADMFESASRVGVEIKGLVAAGELMWDVFGHKPHLPDAIPPLLLSESFIVTRNNPAIRKKYFIRATELGFRNLASLIDSTAVVPPSTAFGAGCYVNGGAVLGGQCTLGHAVFINRVASLGHQTVLDDYVSVGPGATLASHVRVGAGALIGAGATIAPGIAVGSNSVVTVGAVVHKDVAPNTVVAGNPARTVKTGIAGYRDQGV
jgi:sugar O-acyltransferase (sialic acid O-acetyltransferase NeuD family)